ncbi:hypothetical protein V6248_18885 [Pseudoalteromonas agarivorans]|uniref:hypothetical protein n=1 Tax=Pseudoalteromonas agarivorans TaxID=176102 RepID=UPI00311F414D
MLKWILLAFICVFTTSIHAIESFIQAQYGSIKKQRKAIRSQFRSGYSNKVGERLTARDKALFTLLANHCSKPKKSGSAYQATSSTPSRTRNSNWLLNQKVSNMSLHSDSYRNAAKLDTWSKFYKRTKRCSKKKGMELADFVWCSEYRVKQKVYLKPCGEGAHNYV